MPEVQDLSLSDLEERRREILDHLGMTYDEIAAKAAARSLVGDESAAWEALREIELPERVSGTPADLHQQVEEFGRRRPGSSPLLCPTSRCRPSAYWRTRTGRSSSLWTASPFPSTPGASTWPI